MKTLSELEEINILVDAQYCPMSFGWKCNVYRPRTEKEFIEGINPRTQPLKREGEIKSYRSRKSAMIGGRKLANKLLKTVQ